MKFEIDPNELTADQRAHVATFITNWPVRVPQEFGRAMRPLILDYANNGVPAPHGDNIHRESRMPTEEQRLDAEQKEDMTSVVCENQNLNAIFGKPTPTESLEAYVQTLGSVPTVPLDKEGLPWDSRIHASTKTFIADGTWKLRRGVDPAEVEKVKAQLKELMAVPTVRNVAHEELVKVLSEGKIEIPTPPHVVIGVDMASGSDATVLTPIAPAPVLTPASVGYVPVPPAPKSHYLIDQQPEIVDIPLVRPPSTVTLTDLIARMSAAIVAGKMTQATVSEMCAKHGVSEFMLLSSRPDLLPLIDADMKAMEV